MKLHFLVFIRQRRLCINEYIAKIYTKIICNIFSGRFDVHLQVVQSILKFPYLISSIKYPKYVIWNKKIAEKNAMSVIYWNGSEKVPRFIDVCIRVHYLDIVTRIYMYILWLANFRQ